MKLPYKGLITADERADVIVLAAGDYPVTAPGSRLLENAARVVCCDSACVNYINRGGVPEAIVGDCDSLPPELRERYAGKIVLDSDQETNDLTKAMYYCRERGWEDIIILGATGQREDHTLGNISLIADYMQFARVRMITRFGMFDPISSDTRFESFPGQQVSIFTFSPHTLVTTGNLRYPLLGAPLTRWWQGTLNESLGEEFTIGVTAPAVVFRLFEGN